MSPTAASTTAADACPTAAASPASTNVCQHRYKCCKCFHKLPQRHPETRRPLHFSAADEAPKRVLRDDADLTQRPALESASSASGVPLPSVANNGVASQAARGG